MSTEPAPTHLNPDQLLARLIEMEGVIEQQNVALNALDDERNGLKSLPSISSASRLLT